MLGLQTLGRSTVTASRFYAPAIGGSRLACKGYSAINSTAFRSAWSRPSGSQLRRPTSTQAAGTAAAPVATEGMAKAEAEKAQVKYRKDYKATPFLIEQLSLDFNLDENYTRVNATSMVKPNYTKNGAVPEMYLNGRTDVELESVAINGAKLSDDMYQKTSDSLTLTACPEGAFELCIVTRIKPQENSLLEGLYKSGGNFCTQCEAEGFRGITFFYDRPDVMSRYRVRIEADQARYPVLLSNGNLIDSGPTDSPGRHFTIWEDPWPKPCYLFALVAGDLKAAEDEFVTKSGRKVALRIYVQEKNLGKVSWALESLQAAMRWDEERFGLEYDLNLFNIVAVDDFNMGAMENKSLNVFNSRLVLASPATASDSDFIRIQGVIGHEYFHNWTGNRVTCRDWFQLTLKEGLTVYRDEEFTSDLNARGVKRIEDVSTMRSAQFPQDAGPMAHPIRPDSYIKMDNFYTVTVYEKGAQVVRMYETILGRDGFRRGMDLYFQRHDGTAVTCDDFLSAMADANGEDLSALGRWYGQAGTPHLHVRAEYDAAAQTYALTITQNTLPSKDQPDKVPVLIPITVGLLGRDGSALAFAVAQGRAKQRSDTEAVLLLEGSEETFVLSGVVERPVPSLLRNFSAPVNMTVGDQTDEDLSFLLAHDSDPFNRWDAAQRLARGLLTKLYDAALAARTQGTPPDAACAAAGGVSPSLVAAFRSVLCDSALDGSTAAMTVTLPGVSELVQAIPLAEPPLVHAVRSFVSRELALQLEPELVKVLKANETPAGASYSPDAASVARRAIKNKALAMLCATGAPQWRADALARFRAADNMTDTTAAMAAVVDADCEERTTMLAEFYERWKGDSLVTLKWLAMQAMSNREGNLVEVQKLVEHPAFVISNPNSCYSLLLGAARSAVNFHAGDGSGYKFLADMVQKVDQVNHQVAARIVSAFTSYEQVDKGRQHLMLEQLRRLHQSEGLSDNVKEIVGRSVADA